MPKILLVEDNEMNRDMLSRRLQRRGYEVVLAVDGQSGVEMAQTQAPDLVLMDMSLQVLDGWEATRRLKGAEPTRHIPIIALTAHAMSGDRDKALEAGCDDYDTKPVELPRLLGKIETLLGLSGGKMASTEKPVRDRAGAPNERGGPACPATAFDPRTADAAQSDHRILRDADRTSARARPGRLRPRSAEDACCRQATADAHPRQLSIRSFA